MSLKELQVSEEFLKQGQMYSKIKSAKKGGPYSRIDKDKRMNEVYRLHFEYGYSARKIAELMKVNRNTVNGDIDYWYSKAYNKVDIIDPYRRIIITLETMQTQFTRLRELLDKAKSIPEQVAIQRLMYDINSKILHTYEKLEFSAANTHRLATKWFNKTMEKKKMTERNISWFDTMTVSRKAHERIRKIIKEDRISA